MDTNELQRYEGDVLFPQNQPFNAYDSAKEAEAEAFAAERAATERRNAYTASERWGAAFDLTGIIPNIRENLKEDLYFPAADPAYQKPSNEDLIKDLEAEGIPFQYAPQLQDAVSQQHYEGMKRRIKGEMKNLEVLSGASLGGAGYMLGAGIADPVGLGIGVASAGLGVVSKAGKLTNAIRQGLAAGGVNAGLEGMAAYGNPTQDVAERMAIGFGFGAVIGGGVGAWAAKSTRQLAHEAEVLASLRGERNGILQALDNGVQVQPTVINAERAKLQARLTELDTHIARLEGPVASKLHERIQEVSTRRDDLTARLKAAQTASKAGDIEAAYAAREADQITGMADDLSKMAQNERLAEDGYAPAGLQEQADELIRGLKAGEPGPENALQAAMREAGLTRRAPVEDLAALERDLALAEDELSKLMAKADDVRFERELKVKERDYWLTRRDETEIDARNLRPVDPNNPKDFVIEEPGPTFGDTSAGSAQVGEFSIEREVPGLEEVENTPFAWGGKWRIFDAAGWLKTRQNPFLRKLGHIGEDGVGINKDGSAALISAEEEAERIRNVTQVAWRREVDAAFEEFDQGNSWAGKDLRRETFMRDVADAYEAGTPILDSRIGKAVSATRAYFQTYAKLLKESGVRYAQNIDVRTDYLPHIQDIDSIDALRMKYTDKQMNDMLYGSIDRWARKNDIYEEYAQQLYQERLAKMREQAGPDGKSKVGKEDRAELDPQAILAKARTDAEEILTKLYKRISNGYLKSIRDYGKFRDDIVYHGFSFADAGQFRSMMKQMEVADDEIEDMISKLGIASDGQPARFKSRVNFDMDYRASMKNIETLAMEEVSITQLFHRNLDSLVELYGRQVAGHIGLAKRTGIYSRGDFDALKANATEWWHNEGRHMGITEAEHRKSLEYSEFLYKAVIGAPLENDPAGFLSQWSRRVRDMNVMRLMGQVGFAQVAEFGRMLGSVGIPALWKQSGAFRNLVQLAGTGKLDHGLLRELEAMVGTGTHALRNKVFTKLSSIDDPGAQLSNGIDRALHKGKHWTGNLSFMNQITTMQQRMASAAIAQRIVDLAHKGKLTKGQLMDLRSFGMDDAMIDRVFGQLKAHSTKGKKGELHSFALDKWTDQEAAAALRAGIFRATRRIIQDNSYGGTLPFMHTLTGKVIMQFRNFMWNALTKQTMNGLALRNMSSFASLMSSMFLGGLAYVAQTSINYGHDKKALKEKLSPLAIGLASINRSGYSGFVAPIVDTLVQDGTMGTVEGPFSGKRSTQGLATGFVTGNPSFDFATKLYKGTLGLGNAAVNPSYKLSQRDLRNLWGILPYSNTMYAKPGFDLLMENSGLPKYSTRMR